MGTNIPHMEHGPELAVIKFCDEHWTELVMKLSDRNLQEHMALTLEDRMAKFEVGEDEPIFHACTLLTSLSLQAFGPDGLAERDGCPVCAFNSAVDQVADHVAFQFARRH